MKRRILPFSLVVCGAILAYACSSSDETKDPGTNPVPEAGTNDGETPDDDSSVKTDAKTDSSVNPLTNPIEGIAAPTEVAILNNVYTEGPIWNGTDLYFSTYAAGGNGGALVKLTPPNTTAVVRPATAGSYPLGNSFDKKGTGSFVSCEVLEGAASGPLALVRTPAGGTVGTPIVLNFDAGAGFDSPNDLVVRADGTIYVSDPGYQNPGTTNNHIWRVSPTGAVFETVTDARPNGIALSPDEKLLYVSFTDAPSKIMKYAIATDGSIPPLGTLFTSVAPADSTADGLAVDTNGNVYVAVKTGVDVFKADGTAKWGHITTAKVINGLAFGGADKKTLYMTSDKGMLQVNVKIAGLLQ